MGEERSWDKRVFNHDHWR